MARKRFLGGVLWLGLAMALGCEGESPSGPVPAGPQSPLDPTAMADPANPGNLASPPTATTRAAPRDASFSVALPADLLTHPFDSTLMATSADGSYRVFLEVRKTRLLEALGQLKDELIGLGWEVTEERHFEAATLLTLVHGVARHRQERSTWLVQAGPDQTLLCDGLARGSAVPRLGTAHRAVCQSLTLGARRPE